MQLQASCSFTMHTDTPAPSIFMLRPRSGSAQLISSETFITHPHVPVTEYIDAYGNLCQRLTIPPGGFLLESRVTAECPAQIDVHPYAGYTPVEQLPDYALQFLLPSRYCESDKMNSLATEITRGVSPGYPQVEAIRSWVHRHFNYQYGVTNSSTSAWDVVETRTGVCRDYSHMAIALCRNLDIPARMVVGYLYHLIPMDLHAWFEAFVGGRWYTFDATQPTAVGGRIIMAYGRDAADVAFASHFGIVELQKMEVKVEEMQC